MVGGTNREEEVTGGGTWSEGTNDAGASSEPAGGADIRAWEWRREMDGGGRRERFFT
jgi:hypothetical protein